jgi:D-glycero-D-manno-heptose 1,7-bisphosphate phosphatase
VTHVAAVFVDRDGVINELVADPVTGRPESPLHAADVRLAPGASEALRGLADAGWLLVGVSNQPAAAKGTISMAELEAVQSAVNSLLAADDVHFQQFRLCLHHPDGVVDGLNTECDCRKPAPGMLLAAAADLGIDLAASWMVGDADSDVLAGRAAGCRTLLVQTPGSEHKRGGQVRADAVAADLVAAAGLILSTE